jgi:hypothetical protein
MPRVKKPPQEVRKSAAAMLMPTQIEELDKLANRLRYSRSQFLGMLIERGYAAYKRDGRLFEPEDDFVVVGTKKKSKP